jgi:SPX domain protein involved in polyphosphate accumulation
MKTGRPNSSPTLFERYELKFVIPEELIEPISDFCSIYCRPDMYSTMSPDGFYTVNSLYLDTPSYFFLKKRLARAENRFNMRVRCYGDQAVPCFGEIKHKRDNIVRKYRVRMDDEQWQRIFETPHDPLREAGGKNDPTYATLFHRVSYTYNAGPVVLTQYRRKAYESVIDDYARVTFDIDLNYQPPDGYKIVPYADRAVPHDNSTVFEPGCNVILELKCYSSQVPYWMIDLIRNFSLKRRRFSKYVISIREILYLYRYDNAHRQTTAKYL